MRTWLYAVLLLTLIAGPAAAGDDGMFLCRSPVVANDLWTDLLTAQQSGVQVTSAVLKQVADKNECPFIASDNLKPTRYVAGQLLMADGPRGGWAAPDYYILYVNKRLP